MVERGFVDQLDEHLQLKHTYKSKKSTEEYEAAQQDIIINGNTEESSEDMADKIMTYRGGAPTDRDELTSMRKKER